MRKLKRKSRLTKSPHALFALLYHYRSIAALTGGVVGPHYASSKSALHGFVHWLGANVARKGVTVNAVAPALVRFSILAFPREGDVKILSFSFFANNVSVPSQIDDTAMLGGLQSGSDDEEMKQKFADSTFILSLPPPVQRELFSPFFMPIRHERLTLCFLPSRYPHRQARKTRRSCRNSHVDGEYSICDEEDCSYRWRLSSLLTQLTWLSS